MLFDSLKNILDKDYRNLIIKMTFDFLLFHSVYFITNYPEVSQTIQNKQHVLVNSFLLSLVQSLLIFVKPSERKNLDIQIKKFLSSYHSKDLAKHKIELPEKGYLYDYTFIFKEQLKQKGDVYLQ